MTSTEPIETDASNPDAFELTNKLFERSASAMLALAEQMERGDVPTETDIKKAVAALSGTATLVMKERDRVLEQRKRRGGADDQDGIDPEEIRVEIGRQLDRIRDSGRAEDVP